MSLWNTLKKLAGRKAGATRNGTPGSHVNHKANKRTASRAVRRIKPVNAKEIE